MPVQVRRVPPTLANAVAPMRGDRCWEQGKAERSSSYVERRAGLLIGLGRKSRVANGSSPFHTARSQEFLAACALSKRQDLAAECAQLAP